MIARLSRGISCNQVALGLGCAVSTVVQARRRYLEFGRLGLLDRRAGNGETKVTSAFREELRKVLQRTPQDFGWARTTWTRELLALEMERHQFPRVAVCTMGRALAHLGARLGMPKAIVLCPWPERKRQRRIYELRWLAARATDRDPVFFADELDLHFNPKIGRDWMLPGMRRVVITPGKNEKHYLAGALNAKTRKLTWVDDERKNSALFCKLLWRLVSEYKHARRIHIILDNYSIHGSQLTRRCLQQLAGRVVLHFLPPCCPDENDIERLWLDLHSNVTRNHRCRTMPQLLREVDCYLARRNQSLASFNSAGSDREAIRKSTAVLARFNQDEDVRMVIDGMMPSAADAAGLTWMNFHFAQPTVSAQQHYGGEGLPISADRATAPLPASELESRSTMPALDRVGAREGQFGRAVDFGAFELHFVKVRTAKQHVEGGAAQVW